MSNDPFDATQWADPPRHSGDYVGRHRKPDNNILRRTLDLFTHGTQPMSIIKEEKKEK